MSNEIKSITTEISDLNQEIDSLEIKCDILQTELQIATYKDQISKLEVAVQNRRKFLAKRIASFLLEKDERGNRMHALKQYSIHTGLSIKFAAAAVNQLMKDPSNHFVVFPE